MKSKTTALLTDAQRRAAAKTIKDIITRLGSMRAMATQFGVSYNMVNMWANNKSAVSIERAIAIATFFNDKSIALSLRPDIKIMFDK